MRKKTSNHSITRRKLFPILGSALITPFFGFGPAINSKEENKNTEYQTLLKPDGTAVRVPTNVIKKSKVIEKKISNKKFLNWLGRKL